MSPLKEKVLFAESRQVQFWLVGCLMVILPLLLMGCTQNETEPNIDAQATASLIDEETAVATMEPATSEPTPVEIEATPTIPPMVVTDKAQSGYTLVSPLFSQQTYLIDVHGEVVHSWQLNHMSGGSVYLLENGNLLQTAAIEESDLFKEAVRTGGGGYLAIYSWDGELLWEYEHFTETQLQHHDIEPLPNGNILFFVYERYTKEEAIAAGRHPDYFPDDRDEIWSEAILEIDPNNNEIVWEWHVWDHLIQDVNASMANYGDPSASPERIDVNYYVDFDPQVGTHVEWLHANAIDYNAELDQILFNPRQMNEFWIIDHSTTIEEASGSEGDLLFRWGNPEAFGVGEQTDKQLYFHHDPRWIEAGLPGAGNIMLFNNGAFNEREYSTILELSPAKDADGNYVILPNEATSAEIVWQYQAENPETFFSFVMGAAQRQPNGNTLVADSFNYHVFEVTTEGEIVWEWFEPNNSFVFRADRYAEEFLTFIHQDLVE